MIAEQIQNMLKKEATEFGLWLSANRKKTKNQYIDELYKEFKSQYVSGYENPPLKADGFDEAVKGLTYSYGSETPRIVYDKQAMVQILIEHDGMSEEEAYEYLEFNTWNCFVDDSQPIYYDAMSMDEIDELFS